jgi:fatty acid desaturase
MSWGVFAIIYALQLLAAVTVSVMTHNHKHLAMWKSNIMNIITDNWLTVFYGFPVFAWIPTHMINHHTHINTEEDYTRTYRFTDKNNLFTLLTYPSVSGYFQQQAVFKYFKETWATDREKFFLNALQVFSLLVWVSVAFIVDWKKALIFVIIPQQVSLYTVLVFNYLQHVHTDEKTRYNNSRNMTGWLLNFILINNGYHTAHHLFAGIHWSKLPAKHREIESKIHPSLNENNFGWYLLRTYVLGIVIPSFRSQSMRVARIQGHPLTTI